MTNTFADLGLPEHLIAILERRGITSPFPIQAMTIPDVLDGRDVCGRAPTGSGKTLAFGLPLVVRLGRGKARRPRGLILAPTRELAEQITAELRPLAKASQRSMASVYGGVSYGPQRRQLHQGVDLVVACPGRLEDLINQGDVDLRDVDFVVVDEADRMADMGFLPAVRRLLEMTSPARQTVLFSATLDRDVAILTERYQRDPVRHESELQEHAVNDVEHVFWMIDRADRVAHTAEVVASASPSIIFTRTRHGADRLARQLERAGVTAVAMHGGRSQGQRTRALKDFTTGRAQALVATDVAARGIHVEGVASVIHFDPAEDDKAYLHRSGRTARAGASGVVVSLVDGSQMRAAKRLQQSLGMGTQIPTRPVPNGPFVDPDGGERRRRPSTTVAPAPRSAARQDSDDSTLYVGNLPYSFTEDGLSAMFRDHGPVQSATIVKYKDTDRSRGFGFVVVGEGKVSSAIAEIDGREVAGRRLRVKAARPRG